MNPVRRLPSADCASSRRRSPFLSFQGCQVARTIESSATPNSPLIHSQQPPLSRAFPPAASSIQLSELVTTILRQPSSPLYLAELPVLCSSPSFINFISERPWRQCQLSCRKLRYRRIVVPFRATPSQQSRIRVPAIAYTSRLCFRRE